MYAVKFPVLALFFVGTCKFFWDVTNAIVFFKFLYFSQDSIHIEINAFVIHAWDPGFYPQ